MSLVPFAFGPAFQESMIAMMLRDLSFTAKVCKYVPSEHLVSEAHRWLFDLIKAKFEKDSSIPSTPEIEDALGHIERHKRRLLKGFVSKIQGLTPTDPEYIKTKLTEFAKRANFSDLFAYGQTLYNAGKTEESYAFVMEAINEVHAVSFRDDQAIDVADFEELRQRYISQRLLSVDRVPTGIRPLDNILRGGLSKLEGELGVILAEPKKGKSVGLIHMGAAALMMRAGRVAHVVAEGATETTVMRYQSRLTGIPEERLSSDDITAAEQNLLLDVGKRYINRLELIPFNQHWEYTTGDLEARLKELDRRGRTPDLCVIDYADLLLPREKSREERINQREVYRDLKRLGLMRKMATWTASQAQRPKDDPTKEVTLHGSSVSESYEKVRIADFIGTLNQTPHEKKMGIMRFHADIYRNNACDKTIRLITDFERMIFYSARLGHLDREDLPDWIKVKKRRPVE